MHLRFASLLRIALQCLLLTHIGQATAAEDARASVADPQISIHDGFVDEKKCASCHADQAAAFAKSNHAKAMAVADDSTVRANFDDARFEHDGILTTFFKREGRYFVRTEGTDGKQAEFQVKYTFAYEPLQQYLVDIGGGRLQALDIAWDTNKREWFWLGTGKPAKPGTTYHWTGPFYRWNRTCIDCHSTDPQANFQAETGEYKSTYVATSIGCQSCHGGGAKHVEWAEAGASRSVADFGLAPVDQNVCLGCHTRRTKLLGGYGPGQAFLDHFSPNLLRSDLYFPDGQILDEVFEYGSFQQSKMARAGVVCLDCHRQHEATLKADGNAVCTQCHTETKPERFTDFDPSGSFDTPAHTHHPAGSDGALCANCHMPERTYMKVDPRRDHSFVIPRPDLSIAYGTPNACTTCHATQTNAWAAETMDKWYGTALARAPDHSACFRWCCPKRSGRDRCVACPRRRPGAGGHRQRQRDCRDGTPRRRGSRRRCDGRSRELRSARPAGCCAGRRRSSTRAAARGRRQAACRRNARCPSGGCDGSRRRADGRPSRRSTPRLRRCAGGSPGLCAGECGYGRSTEYLRPLPDGSTSSGRRGSCPSSRHFARQQPRRSARQSGRTLPGDRPEREVGKHLCRGDQDFARRPSASIRPRPVAGTRKRHERRNRRVGNIRAARSSQRPIPDDTGHRSRLRRPHGRRIRRAGRRSSQRLCRREPARRCRPIWAQAAPLP